MRDPFAGGRQLAWRVAGVHLSTAVLGAGIGYLWSHAWQVAIAFAWGAGSVAAASMVFARRQMQGVAGASVMLRRFYSAAAWKWVVFFTLFAIGLVVLHLPAGGLLAGLIAAQLAGTWALIRYG